MYKNPDITTEEDQICDTNNAFNWLKTHVHCIKKLGVPDITEEEWDIPWTHRFYVSPVVIHSLQRIKGIRS